MSVAELIESRTTSGNHLLHLSLWAGSENASYAGSCLNLATMAPSPGGGAPLVIKVSQRYYWTPAWQRDEAASVAAVADGDVVQFDDPDQALEWLLLDEED